MRKKPTVFLCGIIQGSHSKKKIHGQSYRQRLTNIIKSRHPDVNIYDPVALYPNSLDFSPAKAKTVFMREMKAAARKDVILVVYLPKASLGTAIEMWEAYRSGNPVFVITPLAINWAVQVLATRPFPTLAAFRKFVRADGLATYIKDKQKHLK